MEARRTLVVNVFGGPGTSKTRVAHAVADALCDKGLAAEYVPSYAKELCWDKTDPKARALDRSRAERLLDGSYPSQLAILDEQSKRLFRLVGQVDFAVTDSPLPLVSLYMREGEGAERLRRRVAAEFASHDNLNLLVARGEGAYLEAGHNQTRAQALEKDAELEALVEGMGIPVERVAGPAAAASVVARAVELRDELEGVDVVGQRVKGLMPAWSAWDATASRGGGRGARRGMAGIMDAAYAAGLLDRPGDLQGARALLDPDGLISTELIDAKVDFAFDAALARAGAGGVEGARRPSPEPLPAELAERAAMATVPVALAPGAGTAFTGHVDGEGNLGFDFDAAMAICVMANSGPDGPREAGEPRLRYEPGTDCFVERPPEAWGDLRIRYRREAGGLWRIGSCPNHPPLSWPWLAGEAALRSEDGPVAALVDDGVRAGCIRHVHSGASFRLELDGSPSQEFMTLGDAELFARGLGLEVREAQGPSRGETPPRAALRPAFKRGARHHM